MLPVVHTPIIFVFVTAVSYKHVILTLLNNPNSNLYYPIIGYFPIINSPHTQLVVTCPVQVGSVFSSSISFTAVSIFKNPASLLFWWNSQRICSSCKKGWQRLSRKNPANGLAHEFVILLWGRLLVVSVSPSPGPGS